MENFNTVKYYPEGGLLHRPENRMNFTSAESLRAAMRKGLILEAPALSADASLSLEIDLGPHACGYIPTEETVLLQPGEKFKEISVIGRVGKAVAFKILSEEENEEGVPRFVLSRRAAQLECRTYYCNTLESGDVIDCKVTHNERYGAFCDIGCGCFALLPVDRISVSRLPHPEERLTPGDCIRAVISSRDKSGKIYLTRRELMGTWEENAAIFHVGQTVTGIVRSTESYGVFIELAPNLAGLAEPCEELEPGQWVSVYIKSIVPEKMKVKLVIIDKCPAASIKNREPRFPIERLEHIDYWRYNPDVCKKTVETFFSEH